jgi:hypothetical protein
VDDDDEGEGDDGRTQVRQPLTRVMVPKSSISGSAHPADEADPTRAYVHPADQPEPTRAMPGAPGSSSSVAPPANPLARIPTRSLTVEDAPSTDVPAFTMTPASVHPPPRSVPPPALGTTRPQMMDRAPMLAQARVPQAPYSQPPPPQPMVAHLSGGYPQQQMPPSGMSQPAHFAVPRMAPSDGRIDPPATVLTQRNGGSTSKTMSWAAALMAVGVFVGLVAAVVAGGGSDTLADTSASFVDPARPSQAKRSPSTDMPKVISQPAAPGMPNVQVATVATTQSVFTQVGPANPAAAPPPLVNAGINPPAMSDPAMAPPPVGIAPAPPPVAVAAPPPQPMAPPPPVAAAAAPAPQDPVASAPPKKAAPVAQAAPPPPRKSAPAPKAQSQSSDDDGVAAAPPPKKAAPAPAAKGGGKGGDDDELKKAADALSKAQLENSL